MLDLICNRYPGRRPSDYLDLDEYTGFQFDVALALRYDLGDKDVQLDMLHALLNEIQNVQRALGVKIDPPEPRKRLIEMDEGEEYVPTLEEALATFGGKAGTIIERE